MKKINYLLIGLALTILSCKKKEEPLPPVPPTPDATALATFLTENIKDATQNFSVDAGTAHIIEGTKGTEIHLSANNLKDSDGNLVTGNVDVELIEIDKRSEMVMMNKATMGVNGSDHATLVSQGEFFIQITQDGNELTLISPMLIRAKVDAYDADMLKFKNISEEEDLLWEMAVDSALEVLDGDGGGFLVTYNILPGEWGWSNIDRFYSDPREKTTIFAELPEGFDDTNTEVFISYDGESGALAQFDVWADGKFTEHYGLIPIGLEVHFIAVAIVDGVLNYSIQAATITATHVQNIDDFAVISEAALVDLIDALP